MVCSKRCTQLAHKPEPKIAGEAFEDKRTQNEWTIEKEIASHEIELNKSKESWF